jgi:hypothetical protein
MPRRKLIELVGSLDPRRAFVPATLFLLRLCTHPTGAPLGARSGNRMRRHSIRRTEIALPWPYRSPVFVSSRRKETPFFVLKLAYDGGRIRAL